MDVINIHSDRNFNEFEDLYAKLERREVQDGTTVTVEGCIHRIRDMSDFAFVILRTGRRLLQGVYDPKTATFPLDAIAEGDFVRMTGVLIVEERSKIGYDFGLRDVTVLSRPHEPLPFVLNKAKLDLGMDMRLDYRPISLRNPSERAIFKISAAIQAGFRKFFAENDFTEIVPPKIVSVGAEGGADMFSVDYFGQGAFLNQSPQTYKQMMVGVFEKVFTIGPVFRAEKSHTNRHITEFQGIDLEMGFIRSFEDIMLAEARALRTVFDYVTEHCAPELALLNVKLPVFDEIPKVRFSEAKEMVAKQYKREFRSEFDLEPEEEKLIGDLFKKKYGSELVFVTHYPTKKRPFYTMDDPEDQNYTCSFDLLLNGSEITTGGQRIHNYDAQLAKMQRLGMDVSQFESYLMMHKYGMPPHGGLGIGLERFTMKLLKLDNIRLATLFPRDVERLTP